MSRHFTLLGSEYSVDDFFPLCVELDLLPLFVKRFIERNLSSSFIPTEDQQISYQKQFLVRENIQSSDDLQLWLSRNDVTEVQLSKQLFHALQIKLLKLDKFESRVEPLFLDSKFKLDQAMYSLIRCSERAKANEIYMRLKEEESSFADLASQFSEGFEQQVNGLIGPLELGRINSSIAERLRISMEGQVWEPFEESGWWVILRLEKLIPARLDSAMRSRLIDILYEDWLQEKVLSEIESLTSSAVFSDLSIYSSDINSSTNTQSSSLFSKVLKKVLKAN